MAYAAVVSLKLTLHRISISRDLFSRKERDWLLDEVFPKLDSFLETIEDLPSIKIVDAAAYESRVVDAVQKLEDLIDSLVSDHRLLLLSDQSSEICSHSSIDNHEISFALLLSQQLPEVNEELSSFLAATLLKISDDKDQQQQQQHQICSRYSSSDYNTTGNQQQNLLVGLDEQIKKLKDWIWDPTPSLSLISVEGMTGIGKTSLVKQVYNDPRVVEEFDTSLFVHIGPHYTRWEEISLLVLNQLGIVIPSHKNENKNYLKRELSDAFSSKKYLVVLDDVWSNNDVLHRKKYGCFPINGKGSRVIIISQIQRYLTEAIVFLVPLLNDNDSWKLLRQTALISTSEDKCGRELEKIGKKIARNCEGLPAAIIQVGENLRGKSFQEWKTLSEKEDPLVITRDDDTPLSKALYFSYMMLPQYLKLCFLYMGVFPKHYEISRSKLTKLWHSEGFVDIYRTDSYPQKGAGEYLDLLIRQSVVLSEKRTSLSIRTTKKCRLHFTFRSLCVNEAKNEKVFHVLKKYTDCIPENIRSHRRLCIHNNVLLAFGQVHEWMESVPKARSLLCFGPKQQYPVVLPSHFRLLKILDALAIRFYEFPHEVLALFHLRYLAITCDGELPNSISRLWNLEVLIFHRHHNIKLSNNGPMYLPIDIWKMHKLKHLYCQGFDLPAPPPDGSRVVLANLLTLSGVSVHTCTLEVLSKIPNLERVTVQIESAHDSIETFSFLGHFTSLYKEFESFKCIIVNPNLRSQVVPSIPKFPLNIKKICLSGCGLPWKNMEVIGSLPNLRVLKLRWYAFCGPHWKTSDVDFPKLEFLLLEDLDIEHWEFDGVQINYLRRVIIRHCYKLKNVPDQLKLVELLEVDDCSPPFVKKMREWRPINNDEMKIRSSITDL